MHRQAHDPLPGWQEKVEGEMEAAPTPALQEAQAMALQAATAAGQVQAACGLHLAPEDFVAGALKWGLMEVPPLAALEHELRGLVVPCAFSGQAMRWLASRPGAGPVQAASSLEAVCSSA